MINKETVKKIKKAMLDKGLNQSSLADKLGVPRSVISNWFNGTRNPKIENIKKIADALQVPLSNFIEDDDFEINNNIDKNMIIDMKAKIDLILEKITKLEKRK